MMSIMLIFLKKMGQYKKSPLFDVEDLKKDISFYSQAFVLQFY